MVKLHFKPVHEMQNPYHRWNCLCREYIKGNVAREAIHMVEWGVEQIIHEFEYQRWITVNGVLDYAIWKSNEFNV